MGGGTNSSDEDSEMVRRKVVGSRGGAIGKQWAGARKVMAEEIKFRENEISRCLCPWENERMNTGWEGGVFGWIERRKNSDGQEREGSFVKGRSSPLPSLRIFFFSCSAVYPFFAPTWRDPQRSNKATQPTTFDYIISHIY